MLTLPIKKKWFDMIKLGEKKEKYREIKSYYISRLEKYVDKNKIKIKFRNGYSKNSPSIICDCFVKVGYGLLEWGAVAGNVYYVLKILSVEEIK